jgi:hypothetical protein
MISRHSCKKAFQKKRLSTPKEALATEKQSPVISPSHWRFLAVEEVFFKRQTFATKGAEKHFPHLKYMNGAYCSQTPAKCGTMSSA